MPHDPPAHVHHADDARGCGGRVGRPRACCDRHRGRSGERVRERGHAPVGAREASRPRRQVEEEGGQVRKIGRRREQSVLDRAVAACLCGTAQRAEILGEDLGRAAGVRERRGVRVGVDEPAQTQVRDPGSAAPGRVLVLHHVSELVRHLGVHLVDRDRSHAGGEKNETRPSRERQHVHHGVHLIDREGQPVQGLRHDLRIERVEGSVAMIGDRRIVHLGHQLLGRHPGHREDEPTALDPAVPREHLRGTHHANARVR